MAAINSAVFVKNAYKHYGPKSGPSHKQVLDGLSMNVQRGTIYGLLGASGCGKTTLLSCIVGRRRFNSGDLWVLGGTPGSDGSGVPGPRIGYMPQEIALVGEFSIRGVIRYFGKLVGMSEDKIETRLQELSDLLDLPPHERCVSECSGGQQRRVSLAAALVHDPELLILDEPTVGLDPVLREKIWEYLVEITATKNTSVIITTHYIEECRQAHKIGLMRQGKVMAEESPAELIISFRAETLEEVFLTLSIRQNAGILLPNTDSGQIPTIESGSIQSLAGESISQISIGNNGSTDMLTKKDVGRKRKKAPPYKINPDRLKALFYKNWYQFFTNYSGVAFMLLFPLLHVTVFFLSIGGDPIYVPLAFVNDENGTCTDFSVKKSLTFLNETDCEFSHMSCRFIQEVEDPMIHKIFYKDLNSAFNDAKQGTVLGVVYFANNFSESVTERIRDGRFVSNYTLDSSEIKVWLDMSNRQIGPIVKGKLLKKYVEFTKKMLKECGRPPKLGEIPVKYNDAVYGNENIPYSVFMLPGLMATVVYFLTAMMTSTVIITDRLEGVWDRTMVAGATAAEVLTAHVSMQSIMMTIQTIEVMIISFAVFRVDYIGNIFGIFGLLLLQGLAGMCYGFLISAMCNSHMMANFISTGSFYPMVLVCGIVWPIEGMPIYLGYIARIMPFTLPIEGIRSIMVKGWGITSSIVVESIGISVIWAIFFIIMTFYLLKRKM